MTSSPRQSDTGIQGCVAKTGGSLVKVAFVYPALSHRHHEPQATFQMASLSRRNHPVVYGGTCGTPQLPKPGRNDVGAGLSVDSRRCIVGFRLMPLNWISDAESTSDQPTTHGGWMRLILKSREMEVLVPSGGFGGQHLGLYSPNGMPRLQFGSSAKCSTPLILRLPVCHQRGQNECVSQSYWQPQSFGDATRDTERRQNKYLNNQVSRTTASLNVSLIQVEFIIKFSGCCMGMDEETFVLKSFATYSEQGLFVITLSHKFIFRRCLAMLSIKSKSKNL